MSEILHGPAYRIETERLVVRCYEPHDAAMLKAAVDASLDHLLPWLPWARDEPQTVDAKVELLRRFRGQFDLGQDFVYGIFDRDEAEVLGGTGLHTRFTTPGQESGVRELGYWVASGSTGRGIATEAAAALVRVAFEVEHLERVEIHCETVNVRSAAIPRKLGFRHDATLRGRVVRRDGTVTDRMVWSLFAAEYEGSPAARAASRAFDAIGREILAPPTKSPARSRSAFR